MKIEENQYLDFVQSKEFFDYSQSIYLPSTVHEIGYDPSSTPKSSFGDYLVSFSSNTQN